MATLIVMDHSGDSRHFFDNSSADAFGRSGEAVFGIYRQRIHRNGPEGGR